MTFSKTFNDVKIQVGVSHPDRTSTVSIDQSDHRVEREGQPESHAEILKTPLSTKFRAPVCGSTCASRHSRQFVSDRQFWFCGSQVCVDVLVSQHFVGDPVEDIEDEEAERENRSGYGVDALGPIHEALVKRVPVVHGHRGRLGEDGGAFCCRSVLVLQAVAQSVTPKVKTTVLSEQFFLLQSSTQEKKYIGAGLDPPTCV